MLDRVNPSSLHRPTGNQQVVRGRGKGRVHLGYFGSSLVRQGAQHNTPSRTVTSHTQTTKKTLGFRPLYIHLSIFRIFFAQDLFSKHVALRKSTLLTSIVESG